ncbi:MAG: hypothetical protein H7230_03610 [Candidatus Parcubacteria bacterium]|nr:hypothetical protein [Candidatus Paceibacterota bacterium]
MTVLTTTKIKPSTKKAVQIPKVKFLRLPMDEMTVNFLNIIQLENPYFSQLDALRYAIGKLIKNQSFVRGGDIALIDERSEPFMSS